MESYVIRIYRRDAESPQNIVGLVELVDIDAEKTFSSFDELRAILNHKQRHTVCEEKKKSGEA